MKAGNGGGGGGGGGGNEGTDSMMPQLYLQDFQAGMTHSLGAMMGKGGPQQ